MMRSTWMIVAATCGLLLGAGAAGAAVLEDFEQVDDWQLIAGKGADAAAQRIEAVEQPRQVGDRAGALTFGHTDARAFDFVRFDKALDAPVDVRGKAVRLWVRMPPDEHGGIVQLQLLSTNGGFLERVFKPAERNGQWQQLVLPINPDTFGYQKDPDLSQIATIRIEAVSDASDTRYTQTAWLDQLELIEATE